MHFHPPCETMSQPPGGLRLPDTISLQRLLAFRPSSPRTSTPSPPRPVMRADCGHLAYDDVVSRSPPIQHRQHSPRLKADRSLAIVFTVPTPASARQCGSRRRLANPQWVRSTPNHGSFQLTLLDTTPRSAFVCLDWTVWDEVFAAPSDAGELAGAADHLIGAALATLAVALGAAGHKDVVTILVRTS
jgi:hypothetical protein